MCPQADDMSAYQPGINPETKPKILVVDDDPNILRAVERLLNRNGFDVVLAESPTKAISILRQQNMAAVVSDQMMPGMTGIELLTLIRQNWPATTNIMMTACGDIRVAADAVNRRLIHYFIPKPWDNKDFLQIIREAVEIHNQYSQDTDHLETSHTAMQQQLREQAGKAAFSLARAVDARDRYTHSHSEKVAAFAQLIGRELGLDYESISELRIGGLLHDVGKIGVPDEILLKPGKLNEDEFQSIKMHPIIGVAIVEPIEFPWNISAIVRQHHENYDGSGYPLGIRGEHITLAARIIHVVDAYEAMSANRIYRSARSLQWIEDEFRRCSGTQFDPEIVKIFLHQLRLGKMVF